MSTEMTVVPAAGLLTGLETVRSVLAPDLSDAELTLFAMVAQRSGLDPFAKQIYAVKRDGRVTFQTGIDGLRSIAARTGEYDGQDEPTFGPDCGCGENPPRHPESGTVRVYRKGMSRPIAATAYWHEYKPAGGASGRGDQMWRKMPHVMLAKVAEALALRKAFPWDPTRESGIGGDVYTPEEMQQADDTPRPSLADRVHARAAEAERPGVAVSLRYFAEMVRDLDPETVRATRTEMYPDAQSVSDLTDEQRATLLERLQAVTEEGEATDVPDEVPAAVSEPVASPDATLCGAIPPEDGMGLTFPCGLIPGHKSAHKSGEGSWPR